MPGHFVDIKQSYVFGMFKALKKFDPAYGVPFLIFKEYYVKNEVEEYVSEMRRGYSMSSSDELKTVRKAMALYIEYGYKSDDATVRRIAAAIGKNEKDTEEIIQRLTETVHYAEFYVKCFDEDGETTGEDVTCDLTAEPCGVYLGIYEEEAVFGAYEKLNYREREMIADHLGFCPGCYGIFEKKEDENGKPFKAFRKGKAFVDLAAEHTLSSGGSAERICNAGYEKMLIDLAIDGYIHIVELRLKEKTNCYVIYEYCADHNNDWGEIRYDFGEDDYEVTRYVYADVKGGFFFAPAGDWIMSQAKRNGFSKRKLIVTKKL